MASARAKTIMIVAGEASGDAHAAGVVRAIRKRLPEAVFFGIGGRKMKTAGVELLVDAETLSVVGITEVFSKLPALKTGRDRARQALRSRKPDLLVLVDFPDFNLHLAAAAKPLGIPVLYYISPQIWAWRRGRIRKIADRIDHMAVILPFEEPFYRAHGVAATHVGHPLMDIYGDRPVSDRSYDPTCPRVGLLPGSRDREIASLLPIMIRAAGLIRQRILDARFVVSRAANANPALFEAALRSAGSDSDGLEVSGSPVGELFSRCDFLVAASGTVTLEAAIAAVPMAIVYKVSPASYWMGRALIRVRYIGLANLIAGRAIVPELIQKAASAETIAETALTYLEDPAALDRMRGDLEQVRSRLGHAGAAGRVADIAINLMRGPRTGSNRSSRALRIGHWFQSKGRNV